MASITPKQLSLARALLGWSRDRLAAVSGTSVYQIEHRARLGHGVCAHRRLQGVDPLDAFRTSLNAAGVDFVRGEGVYLRPGVLPAGMPHVVPLSARLAAFHDNLRKRHLEMARKHRKRGHREAEMRHQQAAAAHEAAMEPPLDERLTAAATGASSIAYAATRKLGGRPPPA